MCQTRRHGWLPAGSINVLPAQNSPSKRNPLGLGLAVAVLGMVFLRGAQKRAAKSTRLKVVPGALLMAACLAIISCGGGTNTPVAGQTVHPSSAIYNVVVTGSAGAIQHSASITVTVP
jgi:hypothetical protein